MVEESDKQVECGDPKRKSIHPTPRVLRGSCLCGGIRYEVDPTVISKKLAHCHCKDCRKHCGAAFSTYAEVPIASIRFTSTSTSTSSEASKLMKSYTASNGSVRQFCSVCGSSLTFRGASQTESIEFSLATLDDLHTAVDEAASDDNVRVLAITGAGGKSFASGSDLAEVLHRDFKKALEPIVQGLADKLERTPKPTIAFGVRRNRISRAARSRPN